MIQYENMLHKIYLSNENVIYTPHTHTHKIKKLSLVHPVLVMKNVTGKKDGGKICIYIYILTSYFII